MKNKKGISVFDAVRNIIFLNRVGEKTYKLKEKLKDGDYPWVVEEGWRLIEESRERFGKYSNPLAKKVSEILDETIERELYGKR